MGLDNFLETPAGQLAQYQSRAGRRIWLRIGIEPRAKDTMPEGDKDAIQQQLFGRLNALHRRAFRGPTALRLLLDTTEKNPAHSHTIAKNLLDLFGRPRPILKTRRRGLLYSDDSQVHALSVLCHHGKDTPQIYVEARPLDALLEDLKVIETVDDMLDELDEYDRFNNPIERFVDLKRDKEFRNHIGDARFDLWQGTVQMEAQQHLLGRAALLPRDLAYLYHTRGVYAAKPWEMLFADAPLRITLSELSQVSDAAKLWQQEIKDKLRAFQTEFGWILDPLLVPVALEVLIKPPPPSRQNALRDLDNVLRNYLIPRVVEILKPVSHPAFAFASLEKNVRRAGPCHRHQLAPV